jgi:ATP-dependent RNA helicase SUPV3L1/SUV3
MNKLIKSDSGVYLAPLRLLALEGYETINSYGLPVSLFTGEEEIVDENSAHICSTIEMCDFDIDTDVAVIDEVQMLEDIDRGWAWVNAIVGVPAKKVIMTGSVNALEAIKKIAKYLDEPLEVVRFQRKNKLQILDKHTPISKIEPYTAIIAFSRNEVLKYKSKLSKNHTVSIIYGNLSPEVRKEEAKRFREGKSDILISTDAIAMGLNLPIKTILFTTDTKFDGIEKRKLKPVEVIQIASRAGRYGLHENGYIGAIEKNTLLSIDEIFHTPVHTIKPPFGVKPTTTQIDEISKHLKSKNYTQIIRFFGKNMVFSGPFKAVNISQTIELAKLIEGKTNISIEQKHIFSAAPVSIKSPIIKSAFLFYINSIINNKEVKYKPFSTFSQIAKTEKQLLQAEDEVKKISLYLWFSYKFPELFSDKDKAQSHRIKINNIIERTLKSGIVLKKEEFKRKSNYKNSNSRNKQNKGTYYKKRDRKFF